MRFIGFCALIYISLMVVGFAALSTEQAKASAPLDNAAHGTQRLMEQFLANPTPQAFNRMAPSINSSATGASAITPSQMNALSGLIQSQNVPAIQLGMGMLNNMQGSHSDMLSRSLSAAAQDNPNQFMEALAGQGLSNMQLEKLLPNLPEGSAIVSQLQAMKVSALSSALASVKNFIARMKQNFDILVARVKRELQAIF